MRRKAETVKFMATMTGRETEGDLAGMVVAPKIVLWVIDPKTHRRKKATGTINHGERVQVLKERKGPMDEVLYFVKNPNNPRNKGWVTARFVLKDEICQ